MEKKLTIEKKVFLPKLKNGKLIKDKAMNNINLILIVIFIYLHLIYLEHKRNKVLMKELEQRYGKSKRLNF